MVEGYAVDEGLKVFVWDALVVKKEGVEAMDEGKLLEVPKRAVGGFVGRFALAVELGFCAVGARAFVGIHPVEKAVGEYTDFGGFEAHGLEEEFPATFGCFGKGKLTRLVGNGDAGADAGREGEGNEFRDGYGNGVLGMVCAIRVWMGGCGGGLEIEKLCQQVGG